MSNIDKCNDKVFKSGVSLGLFVMSKAGAEEFCILETKRTGYLHDWHYIAGRVHIKVLMEQTGNQ